MRNRLAHLAVAAASLGVACATQPEPAAPAPASPTTTAAAPVAAPDDPPPSGVVAPVKKVRRVLPPVLPLTPDDLVALQTDPKRPGLPLRAVAWTMDVWTTSAVDPEAQHERFRGVIELDEQGVPALFNAVDDEYRTLPRLSCDDGGLQRRAAANPSTGMHIGMRLPATGRKVCAGQDAGQSRESLARSEETRVRRPMVLDGRWEKGGQVHDEPAVVTYFEDRVLLSRDPDVWGVSTGKLIDAGDPRAPELGPNAVELDVPWLRRKTGSVEWNVEYVEGRPYRVEFQDQGSITAEKGTFTSWTERNALRQPLRTLVVGTRHPLNKPLETYRAVTEFVYVPFAVATSDPTRTVIETWKAEAAATKRAGSLDRAGLATTISALFDRGLVPASDAQLSLIARLRNAKKDPQGALQLIQRARSATPEAIGVQLLHAGISADTGGCGRVRDGLVAMARHVDLEPRRVSTLTSLLIQCGALGDAARLLEEASHVDYARYGFSHQDQARLALARGRVGIRQGNAAEACAALTDAAEQLPEQKTLISDLMHQGNCSASRAAQP